MSFEETAASVLKARALINKRQFGDGVKPQQGIKRNGVIASPTTDR